MQISLFSLKNKISCPLGVLCALSVLFVFALFGQTAKAEGEEEPEERLPNRLEVFLDEMELTFPQYLEIVAAFEKEGLIPYKLEKNNVRYFRFMRKNPNMPEHTAIAYVNAHVDNQFYTNIRDVIEPDSLNLLVNKTYSLSPDNVPNDLVNIVYGYRMREEAAYHFNMMKNAMDASGLNLRIGSAYRSYYVQERLHRNARGGYGLAYADRGTARAGHSEHQTGLVFDASPISARFHNTPEFEWLSRNAYKYGFILRYPENYEEIHGYKYEPWHWRYVGTDIAAAMRNEGIVVYEEFYGKYLAPEVLSNVKRLILEQRAYFAAQEEAMQIREERERQAAIDAAAAAQEAERLAEEERAREALILAEQERLDAIKAQELSAAEEAARRETYTEVIIIVVILVTALLGENIAKRRMIKKHRDKSAQKISEALEDILISFRECLSRTTANN